MLSIDIQNSQQPELSSDSDLKIVDNLEKCEIQFISGSQLSVILFNHRALFGIIKELCEGFSRAEILEHYGEYMKVRVPKLDKTVGFLFGLMETHKLDDEI